MQTDGFSGAYLLHDDERMHGERHPLDGRRDRGRERRNAVQHHLDAWEQMTDPGDVETYEVVFAELPTRAI